MVYDIPTISDNHFINEAKKISIDGPLQQHNLVIIYTCLFQSTMIKKNQKKKRVLLTIQMCVPKVCSFTSMSTDCRLIGLKYDIMYLTCSCVENCNESTE